MVRGFNEGPVDWQNLFAVTRFYTCQLSHIMRESHACGSKIVTSHIQSNFSCLTDNGECTFTCLTDYGIWEVIRTSSELFNNAQDLFEIFWKSLPALFWSHWKSFYTFTSHRKSSENLRKSLKTFSDLQKSFEIFRNLRKPSGSLQKFRFCGDEKSRVFYWKKFAGIRFCCMVILFQVFHYYLVEEYRLLYWRIPYMWPSIGKHVLSKTAFLGHLKRLTNGVWQRFKRFANSFQTLGKPFANSLQTLGKYFKHFSNPLEMPVKRFAKYFKRFSNPLQTFLKPFANASQTLCKVNAFQTLCKRFSWKPAEPVRISNKMRFKAMISFQYLTVSNELFF